LGHIPIEELDVFRLYEEVADWAWDQVSLWPALAKNTLGDQLVRSIDSVGANLVEGDGRFGAADGLRFFVIARASAREARLWIKRAAKRGLIASEVGDAQIEKIRLATVLLNKLIAYRRSAKFTVAEELALYCANEEAEGATP
jgi:four helix bundle protein